MTENLLALTSDIVIAHVSNNRVDAAALPNLIRSTYAALTNLGQPPAAAAEPAPVPAVAVRSSIRPDFLICLEDGKKLKMLKRYLRATYDLSPEQYRAKWGLPADYPMVAPNYSDRRRTIAQSIGLGQARTGEPTEEPEAQATAEPAAAAETMMTIEETAEPDAPAATEPQAKPAAKPKATTPRKPRVAKAAPAAPAEDPAPVEGESKPVEAEAPASVPAKPERKRLSIVLNKTPKPAEIGIPAPPPTTSRLAPRRPVETPASPPSPPPASETSVEEGSALIAQAIDGRRCLRWVYNRTLMLVAPYVLYTSRGDLFVDAIAYEKNGVTPVETKLGRFKLTGLSGIAPTSRPFPEADGPDIGDVRYQEKIITHA